MRHLRRFALLLTFAIVFPLSLLAADDLLIQAKQQLDNGNAQEAYNLLVPLQSTRAGDPEFDFLLGSAALALGKNTEAVFALERVLAVDPNSAPARAQIARAYFNLKEIETAKREFENVKKQDVPPEVSATIDRFLDAIARVEQADRTVIHGFVEVGIGYDTNVNSATADSQVAVPAFGGLIFTLAPTATKLGDKFFSLGGGLNIQSPVSKQLVVFGGLAYQNKSNVNEDQFSTYSYDANLGLSYRWDRDTVTLVAQYNSFWVDNTRLYSDAYRNASGVTGQWQHDFDSRNQISVYLQYSDLSYPVMEILDANRYIGGLGYAHAFGRGAVITYAGLYGGTEKQKADSAPQLGNDIYGARLGAQWNLNEKYSLFANGSAELRKYGGPDPFFLVDRRDKQYSASGGLIFVPKKNVRLTPQVSWTDNKSNIGINQFDRTIYQVIYRQDM
ncbi:MAG TPA: tetratricopeptide repeat protein [Burkholderiales bacterium]|nr:tetratricopeptide repeat protein [Burkholderiales bacterium]